MSPAQMKRIFHQIRGELFNSMYVFFWQSAILSWLILATIVVSPVGNHWHTWVCDSRLQETWVCHIRLSQLFVNLGMDIPWCVSLSQWKGRLLTCSLNVLCEHGEDLCFLCSHSPLPKNYYSANMYSNFFSQGALNIQQVIQEKQGSNFSQATETHIYIVLEHVEV